VSDQALTILLTSIGAILVATVGAVIGAAVNSRAKIDEGLREQRLQVYPQLWAHTSIVSRWPRTARRGGTLLPSTACCASGITLTVGCSCPKDHGTCMATSRNWWAGWWPAVRTLLIR